MNGEAFDGRFDYVKCSINTEYDRAQELATLWYDTFDPERGTDKAQRHANVQSVRRNKDGTFLYTFEVWGERANRAAQLDFDFWGPTLHRADVRRNIEMTPAGIDRMYNYLKQHKAGAKNLTAFSSRARTKRNGRDTGGYGIAIGSHKSNLRTTFYTRGRESGAYEFQCMASLLSSSVNGVFNIIKGDGPEWNTRKWDTLLQTLYIRGTNDFESVSGLEQHEIATLLLGGANQAAERPETLEIVKQMIGSLDESEMRQAFAYIQTRLF